MGSGKCLGLKVKIGQLINREYILWIKFDRLFECFARFIVFLLSF